ncbi:fumarylacetoacetate hydrolase family protein, partial [Streptomyces sp. NPDC007856]|uniref:fumarylacetoacetate hydrolase family protein n=1 Tax=Streptomyces sp. NPDC007856 TaxID=3364781 RepID=UPI0036C3C526
LPVGTVVEEQDLSSYVAGLVLTNDVSARDVQLTKTQFYESKSYPTFTPTGPYLALLEPEDFDRLIDLRLRLSVNGVTRQDRTLADMIVRPAQALTRLARFQTLDPGDLLLTGTPGGTALKAPPKPVEKIAALLPPALKWKAFESAKTATAGSSDWPRVRPWTARKSWNSCTSWSRPGSTCRPLPTGAGATTSR